MSASTTLPAQRRDVRGTGGRVRGRPDYGLAGRRRGHLTRMESATDSPRRVADGLWLSGEAAVGGHISLGAVVVGRGLRPAAEVNQTRSGELEAVEEPADLLAIAGVEPGRGLLVIAPLRLRHVLRTDVAGAVQDRQVAARRHRGLSAPDQPIRVVGILREVQGRDEKDGARPAR